MHCTQRGASGPSRPTAATVRWKQHACPFGTRREWTARLQEYERRGPEEAEGFRRLCSGELPEGWQAALHGALKRGREPRATRKHAHDALDALHAILPGLIGGSADLASSNLAYTGEGGWFQRGSYGGSNLAFGVREHAMGAICNGLALYGAGLIPFCGTFLAFTDYMRHSIRTAALERAGVLLLMSHDSIGLGEDGPSHQPMEHLAGFRAIPNLLVIRPADSQETLGAFLVALPRRQTPCLLSLSRQDLPEWIDGTRAEEVARGAYITHESPGFADLAASGQVVILLATGSELAIAHDASAELERDGIAVSIFDGFPAAGLRSQPALDHVSHAGAGDLGALLEPAGGAAARVSGDPAAAPGPGPGLRRGRLRAGLGRAHRAVRGARGDVQLWCQRPARGALPALWDHGRGRGRGGGQGPGEVPPLPRRHLRRSRRSPPSALGPCSVQLTSVRRDSCSALEDEAQGDVVGERLAVLAQPVEQGVAVMAVPHQGLGHEEVVQAPARVLLPGIEAVGVVGVPGRLRAREGDRQATHRAPGGAGGKPLPARMRATATHPMTPGCWDRNVSTMPLLV